MSRPKGSKNKPKIEFSRKNNSAVITVNLEKHIEGTPVNRSSSRGWVQWGRKNDFPQRLSDLYYGSVTHKSCIDFAVTAILGEGVDYDAMKTKQSDLVPNYQDTWDNLIEKCSKDFVLLGGYAIQVIKNRDGKTYSFFHQPFGDVRCGERDEDGVITKYYISRDWTNTAKYQPLELPAFGFQEDFNLKSGQAYLYVFMDYSPDLEYYSVPSYIAALKPIQTEIELERFDLRSVVNNFSASGILTLNRVDDEEERDMIIQNIKAMFTGSDNANSLIINFKNNDDEEPSQFVKIDKDAGNNVNLFEQCNDRVISKIIAAHKVSSKALIGYNAESAMLGGQGNVLNVAFNLYNTTVSRNLRNKLVNTFNKCLKMNGIDTEIILKPLSFNIVNASGDETVKTDENNVPNQSNNDTEKATEQNKGKTN